MSSSIESLLPHLLHRSSQVIEEMFARETEGLGITTRQVLLLMVLAENPKASQTTLVAATGIDRSTMADMVRRLRQKDMLTRRRKADDSRAYEIKITEVGEQIIEIGKAAMIRVEARFAKPISERQLEAIRAGLMRAVTAPAVTEG